MATRSDIRYAMRSLGHRPVVPFLIAGLFALSVGLAGGLWAVIDAVALRPLPYPDGDALVAVMERHPERGVMSVTAANFHDWIDRVPSLQASVGLSGVEASLAAGGTPVRVIGTRVTERFFDVMAVTPARGRPFAAADFRGDGRAVIIADGAWQRHFGGDTAIVGKPVSIDGEAYTVVGVMPPGFKTVGNSDIWMPWIMTAEEQAERRYHMVGVMARLARSRRAIDAERELQTIYQQLQADHPDTTAQWTAQVTPLRTLLLGDSRQALLMLGAAVAALLLIASLNIVGLLAAWLRSRRQEFVVRTALGATTPRLVAQVLTETSIWAGGGLIAGVVLAFVFVQLFGAVGLSPALEYDFEPRVDLRVVAAMALLLVVAAAGTTVVPALLNGRQSTSLLASRAAPTGLRAQQSMIVLQVALSIVLLCTSAALLLGFQSVADVASPRSASTVAVEISLPEGKYRSEQDQRRFFEELLAAMGRRREVRNLAAASYVPPRRIFGNYRFAIEGRAAATDAVTTLISAISPSSFQLLGIQVLRGRGIEERDIAAAPRAGVISAALARRYWPGDDPIGHRITVAGDSEPTTIVGVVDDVRQPLSADQRAESLLYLSFRQVPWPFMTMLLEPAASLAPALDALRQEAARLDPSQAIGQPRPLDDLRREWLRQPRLRTQIVAMFGACALCLTIAGLYARMSYAVVTRTREFAIRLAIGARPEDVVRALSREVMLLVLGGLAIALILLPGVDAWVQQLVAGLPRTGFLPLAVVAGAVTAVAMLMVWGPARRAGRIAPAEALRTD